MVGGRRRTAQQGATAQQQFARLKRFGQVIVHAAFKAIGDIVDIRKSSPLRCLGCCITALTAAADEVDMMLRREADTSGDVQIASLLDSLEPILLDIANLPDKPDNDTVRVIRERVSRKNIVALLQVNSTALARALD